MSRVKNPDGTWTDAPPLSLEAHGTGPVTVIRPKAPTARQQEVWDAVQARGTQVAAAKALGVKQGSVQTHLRAYMAAKGIAGPLPGYSKGAYGAPQGPRELLCLRLVAHAAPSRCRLQRGHRGSSSAARS